MKKNLEKNKMLKKWMMSLGVVFLVFIAVGNIYFSHFDSSKTSVPEYPVNNDSFSTVDSEVGCYSKYSKNKTRSIFAKRYNNHWMTWKGTVVVAESNNVHLNLNISPVQDLAVDFEKKGAGYDLEKGQIITVKFLMTSLGGCFMPFGGEQAIILQ